MSAAQPLSAGSLEMSSSRTATGGTPRAFKDHLPGLDGLRGIAAILVLFSHVPDEAWGHRFTEMKSALNFGWFGVDIFFVLSGFLITRILLVDKSRGVPLRYFLARRFLRIFPIYYLALAGYAIWMLKIGQLSGLNLKVLASCILYVSNFFFASNADAVHGHGTVLVLGHTWSLAVEEHFYLLWPFIVYALSYRSAKLFAWLFFLPLAVVSAVLIILHFGPLDPSMKENPAYEWIYRGTMCRAMSLAWGAIFAFSEEWLREHGKKLPWLIAGLIGSAVVTLALRKLFLPDTWRILAQLVCFSVLSASLVLAVIALRNSSAFPQKIFSNPQLRYLGKISYGVYLYHMFVFEWMGTVYGDVPWWRVLLAMAVTVVVASISFYVIEKPILKLQDRFRAKPPAPEVARGPS